MRRVRQTLAVVTLIHPEVNVCLEVARVTCLGPVMIVLLSCWLLLWRHLLMCRWLKAVLMSISWYSHRYMYDLIDVRNTGFPVSVHVSLYIPARTCTSYM